MRSGTCLHGTCPGTETSNYAVCPTQPNPAPEGRTETLQLTFFPQVLAWYIQCQHVYSKMYISHPCARRAHRNPTTYIHPPSVEVICWYWIYHAKTWGMNVSWSVSVWGIYVSWKNRLVLDILCQHLGAEWSLESFCAPFGRRVGECTFLNIYVGIEYIMPTMGGWV